MYMHAKFIDPARHALLIILCAALLCSGCAPVSAPVATPAPTPASNLSGVPEATPVPEPDYAALSARVETVFHEAFCVDPNAFTLPEMQYITELMAERDAFLAMQDAIETAARAAFAKAYADVCGEYASLPAGHVSVSLPGWQELMGLYRVLGTELASALAAHCKAEAELEAACVSLSVSFPPYEAFVGTSGHTRFSFTTLYAYLNTVYDEDGNEAEYVDEPLPEEYLATLSDPLPGRRIKDGWFGPRSQSTRKHTGTDIRAAADEPILSCTDGCVLSIGTGELAGNYVVILDDFGYEYHYYHMIRVTDFLAEGDRVAAGDVIGNVGNTGNSDANHLHLAIVTPEKAYINPYPVLLAVRELEKASR